jgi:hypothetical protein
MPEVSVASSKRMAGAALAGCGAVEELAAVPVAEVAVDVCALNAECAAMSPAIEQSARSRFI